MERHVRHERLNVAADDLLGRNTAAPRNGIRARQNAALLIENQPSRTG
jgi:hypothetical protein